MWVSPFDHLFALSIPDHGQKDFPPGVRNVILNELEGDLVAWDEWLSARGE
jgi:hypothetical protein